jgi:hypothetical protein
VSIQNSRFVHVKLMRLKNKSDAARPVPPPGRVLRKHKIPSKVALRPFLRAILEWHHREDIFSPIVQTSRHFPQTHGGMGPSFPWTVSIWVGSLGCKQDSRHRFGDWDPVID